MVALPQADDGGKRIEGLGSVDHEVRTVDVSAWSGAEAAAIDLLLRSANIAFERQRSTLVFPSARAAEVAGLVDSLIGGGFDVAVEDDARPSTPPAMVFGARLSGGGVVAGGLRRLGGWFVDMALLAVCSAVARTAVGPGLVLAVAMFVVVALYQVLLIRLFGRTAGKAIVRTRVVNLETGGRPSWLAALGRWAVPAAVLFAGSIPVWGVALQPIGAAVVFGGVLFPPYRRGVHDLVAGTVVILEGTEVA